MTNRITNNYKNSTYLFDQNDNKIFLRKILKVT